MLPMAGTALGAYLAQERPHARHHRNDRAVLDHHALEVVDNMLDMLQNHVHVHIAAC